MKKLWLLIAILFVTGFGAAETVTLETDFFTSFQNDIDSCSSSYGCTTSDDLTTEINNGTLHIDTGSTGYCGVGGFKRAATLKLPETTETLNFRAKARKDAWGSNYPIAARVNGEFVKEFNTDGGTSGSWPWDSYSVDVSEYAGQNVNISFVVGDKSEKYCDMGDHEKEFWVSSVSITRNHSQLEPVVDFNVSKVTIGEPFQYTYRVLKDGEPVEADVQRLVYFDGKVKRNFSSKLSEVSSTTTLTEDSESFHGYGEYRVEIRIKTSTGYKSASDSFTLVENQTAEVSPVCDSCGRPTDPNGDGLYEDVNGDGTLDFEDVIALLENLDHVSPKYFGFASTDEMEVYDVSELSDEIQSGDRSGRFVLDDGESAELKGVEGEVSLEQVDITDAVIRAEGELRTVGEGENLNIESGRLKLIESRAAQNDSGGKGIAVFDWSPSDRLEEDDLSIENLEFERERDSIFTIRTDIRSTDDYRNVEIKVLPMGMTRDVEIDEGTNEFEADVAANFRGTGAKTRIETGEIKYFRTGRASQGVQVINASVTTGIFGIYEKEDSRDVRKALVEKEEGEIIDLSSTSLLVTGVLYDDGEAFATLLEGDRVGGEVDLGLHVDPENDIEERNEDNNRETATVNLGSGSAGGNENRSAGGGGSAAIVEINLQEGWNMISSSAELEIDVEDIEKGCSIAPFDGKKTLYYREGRWGSHDNLKDSYGYFVKSDSDCSFEVLSDENPIASETQRLSKGWNTVSVPESMSLEEARGDCSFERFRGAHVWHYGDGEWQQLGTEEELNPMKGYYVNVASACTLNFGESPEAPPSPTGNFFEQVTELFQ